MRGTGRLNHSSPVVWHPARIEGDIIRVRDGAPADPVDARALLDKFYKLFPSGEDLNRRLRSYDEETSPEDDMEEARRRR